MHWFVVITGPMWAWAVIFNVEIYLWYVRNNLVCSAVCPREEIVLFDYTAAMCTFTSTFAITHVFCILKLCCWVAQGTHLHGANFLEGGYFFNPVERLDAPVRGH